MLTAVKHDALTLPRDHILLAENLCHIRAPGMSQESSLFLICTKAFGRGRGFCSRFTPRPLHKFCGQHFGPLEEERTSLLQQKHRTIRHFPMIKRPWLGTQKQPCPPPSLSAYVKEQPRAVAIRSSCPHNSLFEQL